MGGGLVAKWRVAHYACVNFGAGFCIWRGSLLAVLPEIPSEKEDGFLVARLTLV